MYLKIGVIQSWMFPGFGCCFLTSQPSEAGWAAGSGSSNLPIYFVMATVIQNTLSIPSMLSSDQILWTGTRGSILIRHPHSRDVCCVFGRILVRNAAFPLQYSDLLHL